MDGLVTYSIRNRDELTIMVLDQVTDVLRSLTKRLSESRLTLSVGIPEGPALTAGVERIKDSAFRDDKRLGRWSGPIPRELLLDTSKDSDWELTFDRILSLKMGIEKLPDTSK